MIEAFLYYFLVGLAIFVAVILVGLIYVVFLPGKKRGSLVEDKKNDDIYSIW